MILPLTHDAEDPTRTALIVVDAQNDYCVPGGITASMGFSVDGRSEVASRIGTLADRLRLHLGAVFFVRTETPSWGRSGALRAQYARNALQRIPDASMLDWFEVAPEPCDHVITKTRYSAFHGTELDAALRALRIETVVVCGFTTEVCVDSTVRDAFLRDYHVICVSDCTAASTPERHRVALEVIDTFFGRVVSSDQLFPHLSAK